MKLKKTFIVNEVAGETLVVPVTGDFHGIIKAHGCSDFILTCLKDEISEDALVDRLVAEYDVDRERAAADTARLLAELRELGALEE